MDGVTTLLKEAKAAGLTVSVDGELLIVRGPKQCEPLAKRILEAKPDVVRIIRARDRYDVPDGWTRERWAARLRYLAGVCDHAGRAAELRAWADGLEAGQ